LILIIERTSDPFIINLDLVIKAMEGTKEIDSNMQKFLNDRKISIGDLSQKIKSDTSESAADRNQRQRDFAIRKRVSSLAL